MVEDTNLEKVTLRLPARYIRALDFLVKVDDFPSRSEAIRAAIRDFVYDRVDVVMDKVKKMEEAEKTLAEMETFEQEYLRK
jgi:Arc/MetJ-type ribon-helix-helix transcriptional regulator